MISWCRLEVPDKAFKVTPFPTIFVFQLVESMTAAVYTFRQGDLPMLDLQVDRETDFTAWWIQWESYCTLFGLAEEH